MASQTPDDADPPAFPRHTYRNLPGSIWALGLVSMCMDTSSELIHSLLPILMVTALGTSMTAIGMVEGVAEAMAAITKVFSGIISDHFRKRKPLVVHRIDRDTSGLVLFALRPDALGRLKGQFRRHEPERVYLAIVYGHPNPEQGTWRDHLVWDERSLIQKETHPKDPLGKEARSDYRVLEWLEGAALIEVRLETGRRNQIRLQARLRGHTLVGEQRYTYGSDELRSIPFKRQALHAHRLGFVHPLTEQPMRFELPLPADMQELLDRLRRGERKS